MAIGQEDWTRSTESTIRIGAYILKTNVSAGADTTIYTVPANKEFLLMYAQCTTHEIADEKEVLYKVNVPGLPGQTILSLYTAITPTYKTKNAQTVTVTPAAPVVYPAASLFYIGIEAGGGKARAVLMGFERDI